MSLCIYKEKREKKKNREQKDIDTSRGIFWSITRKQPIDSVRHNRENWKQIDTNSQKDVITDLPKDHEFLIMC